jgi:two-component system nitrogen regulation sensor histidine kinase NtrY
VELVDAEPDATGRVGACVTFTLPLSSPNQTSADAGLAYEASPEPTQMEAPLFAAVVHK